MITFGFMMLDIAIVGHIVGISNWIVYVCLAISQGFLTASWRDLRDSIKKGKNKND